MNTFIRRMKKGIPKINIQAMTLSMRHRLFLFFIAGIIIGTMLLNLWLEGYAGAFGIYSEYFVNNINMYGNMVDKMEFGVYCLRKYLIEGAIIIFFNITAFGKIFNCIYCMYKGIVIALLISSSTLTYGTGGLLLYIISIFPHYFIYVPFFIASIYVGIQVSEIVKEKKMKKFKIRAVICLILLAVGTAFLEAYVNYPILRATFS